MPASPLNRRRAVGRVLLVAAKLALSAWLIYYAFGKIDLREAWLRVRDISIHTVTGMACLLFLDYVVAAARLRQILNMLGARCRFFQALDIVFVGAFFSQTLISFVGGDAMRIWRIVRSNVNLGLAAKGVVVDRLCGLAALLILVAATFPFLLDVVTNADMRAGLIVAVLVGISAFGAFVLLKHMPSSLRRLRLLQWVSELSAAAASAMKSTRTIASLLGLSLSIHVLNVATLYLIAAGLSLKLSFWHALLLMPPVLFLSLLPISFAGWGVREGAMIVALGLVGIAPSQAVALSVCFGLSLIATSIPGAVLWLVRVAPAIPLAADASDGMHHQEHGDSTGPQI